MKLQAEHFCRLVMKISYTAHSLFNHNLQTQSQCDLKSGHDHKLIRKGFIEVIDSLSFTVIFL